MITGLVLDSGRFFEKLVEEAFDERGLKTDPYMKIYVVDILKYYLFVENLYDQKDSVGRRSRKPLAEILLSTDKMGTKQRLEKLKKLADSSLYISGFFSDSFQRKIIDIDYYVDIGKLAYNSLAHGVEEDLFSELYREISNQFMTLVDALSFISQKAEITDKKNLLRTMDVYAKTGSSLREKDLAEKGVFSGSTKSDWKQ